MMQIPWEKAEDSPVQSSNGRKLVPVGTYVVKVHSAEIVKNFRGYDSAKVILSIQGGACNGTWITEYFDIGDPDADRARLARRKLQHLAVAAGIVDRPYTVLELIGSKVQVKTKLVESAKWGVVPKVARFDPLPAIAAAGGEGFDQDAPITAENLPF